MATCVVTDSREARPGALFVCVPGERVDGHDFAARAVERGAAAVLASRPLPDVAAPVLLVEDTVRALGSLAALWRGKPGPRWWASRARRAKLAQGSPGPGAGLCAAKPRATP